ncbi:NAD(P)-binding protein [Aspergillus japonicus CBS 114.51]|uniref:NAD(P)-binding protein n=1 Tax=Aspergillus japonicus CBS 114.51 TaxID=1448312 RepID=A0A8T8WT73_ASPJA|nr:NAD(P)-binding protein [Aspergillus japonicus CBS 114.51]RAH78539.1 NAD(P)-binding protein [Aspergillus japonicus CBS 114.51]
MEAIRLHPAPPTSPNPYSPTNPAPATALHLDAQIPIPKPSRPGELLIRVHATTIVRDMLAWPETYHHDYAIPGNDLAGTVIEVFDNDSSSSSRAFHPGDEVLGMTHADRAATWAEYTVATAEEVTGKPAALSWAAAAGLPLSALTAYEALFVHAGVVARPSIEDAVRNATRKKLRFSSHPRSASCGGELDAPHAPQAPQAPQVRILVTGAAGAVGIHLVQLASAVAGAHVVAATSSDARNREFLRGLGADETVEYADLEAMTQQRQAGFDVVVDAVGGEVLARCWGYVKAGGALISVDSSSFDFVERHRERGIGREDVRALFFVVQGGGEELRWLAGLAGAGALVSLVNRTFPFERVREAYEFANGRYEGRGKVVLVR